VLSFAVEPQGKFPLVLIKHFGTTSQPATGAGSRKACLCALTNQVALKLGQSPEQVKYKSPPGGRGVNVFLQAPETDTSLLQSLDQMYQILEGTTQPVEAPDHQCVVGTQDFESGDQAWAVGASSTQPVYVYLAATSPI
jgi:hypothetical protein